MKIPKVLIIKHGSIGDIFMSLNSVSAIKKYILISQFYQLNQVIEYLMNQILILKKLLITEVVLLILLKFYLKLLIKTLRL